MRCLRNPKEEEEEEGVVEEEVGDLRRGQSDESNLTEFLNALKGSCLETFLSAITWP